MSASVHAINLNDRLRGIPDGVEILTARNSDEIPVEHFRVNRDHRSSLGQKVAADSLTDPARSPVTWDDCRTGTFDLLSLIPKIYQKDLYIA